jgi:hypothetical protein
MKERAMTDNFYKLTLPVPEHWLPALFGVSEEPEEPAYQAWRRELQEIGELWSYGLEGEEPERFFAWDHEGTPYGVGGCMCYDVVFVWKN